jgi:D-alanyl-D-alanine endopeptidase (penicillin-binding protein 7)
MVHHPKHEHIDIFLIYGLSLFLIMALAIVHLSSVQINVDSLKRIPKKFIKVNVKNEIKDVTPVVSPLFNQSAFNDVHIEGKAYIVYDLVTQKVIASKNEKELLPLASITKMMTAVSSTLHEPLDTKITINPGSIEDGYDLGLKNKQVWALSELLKYTLVFSSNDGAEAIADSFGKETFIKQMNNDAKVLGLNFFFTDPAGRDIGGMIGGKGTVLDVARLFGIAHKNIPEVLDATTKKRQTVSASTGKIRGIPNTNQEIENLPGAEASKTGYTDAAGGNLGVIVDISIGHPVVIVVLGSTREGRFKDMDMLYKALQKSIQGTISSH